MNIGGTTIAPAIVLFAFVSLGVGLCVIILCGYRAIVLVAEARATRQCTSLGDLRDYLLSARRFASGLRPLFTREFQLGTEKSDSLPSGVSNDALATLAVDTIDEVARSQADALRSWAYMPLLIGLCGTVIGLMTLLQTDPIAMQLQLGGVLAGTLSGVTATTLATAALSGLESVAVASQRAVTELVFRVAMPNVRERKVAIDIEGRLMDVIETRSQALVDEIGSRLNPLAEVLGGHARSSTQAASLASESFGLVLDAIKGAPALAQITRRLLEAAKNAQEAANVLMANSGDLQEIRSAERVGVQTVLDGSKAIADSSVKLVDSVNAIQQRLLGDAPSLTSAVATIERDTGQLATLLGKLSNEVNTLGQELIGLSVEVKGFGERKVTSLSASLETQAQSLVTTVREQLEGAPGRTSDALEGVGLKATALAGQLATTTSSVSELDGRLRALVTFVNEQVGRDGTDPRSKSDDSLSIDRETRMLLAQSTSSLAASAKVLEDIALELRKGNDRKPRVSWLRGVWRGATTT